MNISIIGAGNVGSALAAAFSRAGHDVTISATERSKAAGVAAKTGAHAATTSAEAVKDADIVVLAVPVTAIADVANSLRPALAGKVVVDVANRPTPDDNSRSIAEELQQLLPEARVVKAFNTVFASRQAQPDLDGSAVDGYVAADDEAARRSVLELVESIGMRPIDVGELAVARTLEAMAWLHISLAMKNGWTWQSGWKLIGPTLAKAA
jgi:hypothetical protein